MQRSVLALVFLGLLAGAFADTATDGTVIVGTTATTAAKDTTIVGTTATAPQSVLFTYSSASSLSPFWMSV